MSQPERRDEAGRRESDHIRTTEWVLNELIPALEKEAAGEPEADVVPIRPVAIPRPRKVRIGEVLYDVYPQADERDGERGTT